MPEILNTRFITIDEIALDLRRPRSTVAHWAAGTRAGFPRAVRLPNGNLLIESVEYEAWACADAPVDCTRADGATRGPRLRLTDEAAPVSSMNNTDTPIPGNGASFLTLADVATLLRQSPSTVAKWAARGGPDFPKASRLPNRQIIVEAADLERWLKARRS